jgi:acetylornithine deacetylase/succinyl-diaminopimelate desuccinylase-like protein
LIRALVEAGAVLNEGGGLLLSPDASRIRSVRIGSAEKTYQSYSIVSRGVGGHSSMPGKNADPVTPLARALVKVGEHKFPAHLLPAAKDGLAERTTWEPDVRIGQALKHALASAPAIAAEDEAVLSAEPSINNTIRTTCVATQLEGAAQDNVLPTVARAVVNCRILPDETREGTLAALSAVIGDAAIEVKPVEDNGMGPPSPIDGELPDAIRKVALSLWPGVAVSHALGAGATDSRHLRPLGIPAYGISTSPITLDELLHGRGAHGTDERRLTAWLSEGTRFLDALTRELVR